MSQSKPFTGIMYFAGKMYPIQEREIIYSKFFYRHPRCTFLEINDEEAIAYYTDPIYPAILLNKSSDYFGKMCLLSFDHTSRKLHPRVLTIWKNKKYIDNKTSELIFKSNGRTLKETTTKLIIKLPSFLKTTQLKRDLEKIKMTVKFTNKKLVKKITNEIQ